MMDASAAYTSADSGKAGLFIVHTPFWVSVVRGFQAFLGFIILILAGHILKSILFSQVAFSLVCVS
jgi:hypothetical protein